MNVIDMSIEDIKPYENNPRKNDKAVEVVAKSIQAYGFNSPIIVDRDFVIINGHTRYAAAKYLQRRTVPVVVVDLSPDMAKAYRIMDNKSAEFSVWDEDKLLKEIVGLLEGSDVPLELTGYDQDALSKELGLAFGDTTTTSKKKKKKEVEGELEFSAELLEEHQYLVLYFDNTLDWQVAKQALNVKSVKRNEQAADRVALGRVVNGKEFLRLIGQGGDDT